MINKKVAYVLLLLVVILLCLKLFIHGCWATGWGALAGIGDKCSCNGKIVDWKNKPFFISSSYRYVCIGILEEPANLNQAFETAESHLDSYLPVKNENNFIGDLSNSDKVGWKRYINKKAQFTIDYPEKLMVMEEHNSNEGFQDSIYKSGRIIFCSDFVQREDNYCKGGLQVRYGIPHGDGWGGGCDEKFHGNVIFLEKKIDICKYNSGINQIYGSHPQLVSEVSIVANYNNIFREVEALEMLESFIFLEE